MKERSRYISVVKGIGIIAVVLGHTDAPNAERLIYFWHLPLFFFLIGYTYNKEKYERNVSGLMLARLKSFFPMYFVYMCILFAFHNLFFTMGILPDYAIKYNIQTGFEVFWNFIKLSPEPFAGPLWFMKPYICATFIWGVIMYAISFVKQGGEIMKQIAAFILCLVLSTFGVWYGSQGWAQTEYGDVALAIMIFVVIGYFCQVYKEKIKKIGWCKGAFIFFILLTIMLVAHIKFKIWPILDQRQYYSQWLWYLLAFSGIYCCFYGAAIINKSLDFLAKFIGKIGDYSMDIMTLHLAFFKLLDYVVVQYRGGMEACGVNLHAWPNCFSSNRSSAAYTIVGVFGPIVVRLLLNKFGGACRSIVGKING